MKDNSKRDIYDLIAELAKSSNIDIDGTEFISPEADARKKPLAKESNEPVNAPEPSTEKLIYLEPAPKELIHHAEISFMEQLNQAKAASLEEMNLLKREMIDEIKSAHRNLIKEIKNDPIQEQNSLQEIDNTVQNSKTIINSSRSESEIAKLEEIAIEEFSQVKASTIAELDIAKEKLLKELSSIRNAQIQPEFQEQKQTNSKQTEIIAIEFLKPLSIQQLNEITSEASKQNGGKQVNANLEDYQEEVTLKVNNQEVENSVIQDQLKKLYDKMDELNVKNLKSEIVTEIKLSDERIVHQVSKTTESILTDISLKLNHSASTSNGDSFIKWLSVINLMLLLLAMMYLFMQRMNEQSAAKSEKNKIHNPISNQSIGSQVTEFKTDQNAGSINSANSNTAQNNEIQESGSETNLDPNEKDSKMQSKSTNNPSFNHKKELNHFGTLNSSKNNAQISLPKNDASNAKQNENNQLSKANSNQANSQPKTEVSKKSVKQEDVIFGED